jgi:hypothetical protein
MFEQKGSDQNRDPKYNENPDPQQMGSSGRSTLLKQAYAAPAVPGPRWRDRLTGDTEMPLVTDLAGGDDDVPAKQRIYRG